MLSMQHRGSDGNAHATAAIVATAAVECDTLCGACVCWFEGRCRRRSARATSRKTRRQLKCTTCSESFDNCEAPSVCRFVL